MTDSDGISASAPATPSPGTDRMGAGFELAYREAQRWLDDQSQRLDTLRSRIGALVSAAGVVNGFLTAVVFGDERAHALSLWGNVALALAALSLVVMCIALVVLWSPKEMSFNLHPRTIIDGYARASPPRSIGDTHLDLALYMGDAADDNQDRLADLQRWFSAAAISFLVGLLSLGVAVWDVQT